MSNAYGSNARVGEAIAVPRVFLEIAQALAISSHAAGVKPMAVNTVDDRRRRVVFNHRRHFKTTSLAHQKFATLSSKRPRLKGKIRVTGSLIDAVNSQGANKTINVPAVTKPNRMNRPRLQYKRTMLYEPAKKKRKDTPFFYPKKKTFPKVVRTDSRCII